jgi:hypothetical protein
MSAAEPGHSKGCISAISTKVYIISLIRSYIYYTPGSGKRYKKGAAWP